MKRLLYNFFLFITLASLIIFSFFFVFVTTPNNLHFLWPSVAGFFLFLIFRKTQNSISSKSKGEFEKIEEKINLLTKNIEAKKKILQSLPRKRKRVSFLFNVSQNLIELIDPEEIFDFFINNLGDLFPQANSILIFDFDSENDSLTLVRSLKRRDFIIKEKMGNDLDKWVLRQNRSLLIEDLTNDFRFDYNKISAYKDRGTVSFVVSPISIAYQVLGIVRVEAESPLSFSLDDSRILRNICDLGAVVLERARLIRHAQDLAIRDSLTSLFLKDYFFERLELEIKRAAAKDSKLGIIMLDIDDFKKINDNYGHIVGDTVLAKLARILTNIAGGAGNVISRFGGEEFIISLVECEQKELLRIAEEIRESIAETKVMFRRKKINFTVSLGAALYPDDAQSSIKLVDKVDKLMYKAKQTGKNKVCFSGQ